MKFLAILTVILPLSMVGCSALKNMDEMKTTTGTMSDTTKGMSETTKGMSQTTNTLYTDSRQGQTLSIRNDKLKAVQEAPSIEEKIFQAGAYLQAFETEKYTGEGPIDSVPGRLDQMKLEAVQEFLFSVRSFISDLSNTSPGKGSAKWQNLYALVTMLHATNSLQGQYGQRNGFAPISMLNMLEESLAQRAAVNSGTVELKSLPEYQRFVLEQATVAIYLLQLRRQFLAVMPLGTISNIDSGVSKIKCTCFAGTPNSSTTTWPKSKNVSPILTAASRPATS